MNTKLFTGIAIVLSIVALAVGIFRPVPERVIERITERLGAFPGREITENDFSIGGQRREYHKIAFNTATSTLCSILSPNATSTMVYGSMQALTELATTSPPSGAAWVMGTGASHGVTTTAFGAAQTISVKAARQIFYATTTNGAALLSPRTWVSGRYTNPGITEYSQVSDQRGHCEFEFVIN